MAGVCVACLGDGDCPHARPACVSGTCVECRTRADCAALRVGGDCDTTTGRCSCAVAADCAGSFTAGNECLESSLWGRRCGCGSCVGNVHGAQCAIVTVTPQCTCRSDQECTLAPYTRCAPLDSFSGMSECKPPCTSDADCDWKATGLRRCILATGKCGVCTSDADCASERFARHCSPEARCVGCTTPADCAGSPLGPWCGNGECRCTSDSDCSVRSGGKHCDVASFVCSCRTDGDCPTGAHCLGVISVGGRLVSQCQ